MEGFSDMMTTVKNDLTDTVRYNIRAMESAAQKIDESRRLEDYGYKAVSLPEGGNVYVAPAPKKAIFKEPAPIATEQPEEADVQADKQLRTMSPKDLFGNIKRGTQHDFGTQVGFVIDGVITETQPSPEETEIEGMFDEMQNSEQIPAEAEPEPVTEAIEDAIDEIEVQAEPVEETEVPVREEIVRPAALDRFLHSDVHGVVRQEPEAPVMEEVRPVPEETSASQVEKTKPISVKPNFTMLEFEDQFEDKPEVSIYDNDDSDIVIIPTKVEEPESVETEEVPVMDALEPDTIISVPEETVTEVPVADVPVTIPIEEEAQAESEASEPEQPVEIIEPQAESSAPADSEWDVDSFEFDISDLDVVPAQYEASEDENWDVEAAAAGAFSAFIDTPSIQEEPAAEPEVEEERICIAPAKVVKEAPEMAEASAVEEPQPFAELQTESVELSESPVDGAEIIDVAPVFIATIPEWEFPEEAVEPYAAYQAAAQELEAQVVEEPVWDVDEAVAETFMDYMAIEPEFGPSNIIVPDWVITDEAVESFNAFQTIRPQYIRAPVIEREWDLSEASAAAYMRYTSVEPEFGPSNIVVPDWPLTDEAVESFNAYMSLEPEYIQKIVVREWDLSESSAEAYMGYISVEPEFGPSNIIVPDWVVTDEAVDSFNAFLTIRPQYIRAPVIEREWDITEGEAESVCAFRQQVEEEENRGFMNRLPKTVLVESLKVAPLEPETYDVLTRTSLAGENFANTSTAVEMKTSLNGFTNINIAPRKTVSDRSMHVTRFVFKNGKLQKVESEPEPPKRKECRIRIKSDDEDIEIVPAPETVSEVVESQPEEEILVPVTEPETIAPAVEPETAAPIAELEMIALPVACDYEVLPAAEEIVALPVGMTAIPLPAASQSVSLPSAGYVVTLPAAESYIALPEAKAETVPEKVEERQRAGVFFSFGDSGADCGSVRFSF